MRVKCLAQEHDTMSPARACTRTAQSGDELTNHEATTPPTAVNIECNSNLLSFFLLLNKPSRLYREKNDLIIF